MDDAVCAFRVSCFPPYAQEARVKLAALIIEARDEIAQRFADRLFAGGAAEGLSCEDVIDSLREFLAALAAAMVADLTDGKAPSPAPPPGHVARVHGVQRLKLGYEVGAVIREYGTVAIS
jgi:hypothetical protein